MNEETPFTSQQTQDTPHDSASTAKLEQCLMDLAGAKDKYLRLQADFENYKRRSEKEKMSWMLSAQAGVLLDVVTIVDDFDRALSEAQKNAEQNPTLATWVTGIELINKALYKLLSKYGVEPMKDYTIFDPEKHEALMHVESPDHQSGQIVSVLQKGFMHKDTVLRPAKVSVAR